jgi:hypothetical protein
MIPAAGEVALRIRAKLFGFAVDEAAVNRGEKAMATVVPIGEAHLAQNRWMLGAELSLVDRAYSPIFECGRKGELQLCRVSEAWRLSRPAAGPPGVAANAKIAGPLKPGAGSAATVRVSQGRFWTRWGPQAAASYAARPNPSADQANEIKVPIRSAGHTKLTGAEINAWPKDGSPWAKLNARWWLKWASTPAI